MTTGTTRAHTRLCPAVSRTDASPFQSSLLARELLCLLLRVCYCHSGTQKPNWSRSSSATVVIRGCPVNPSLIVDRCLLLSLIQHV